MTEAMQTDLSERQAVEQVIQRLHAEGWSVVEQPGPQQLPEAVAPFRPDLVAHRGAEHLIVEIKSRQTPPDFDMVTLAEQIAALPGWRLDLVYVPQELATADRDQLLRWAATANALAASAPEAAMLLVWAAIEGLLHQLAEARGVDTNQPGRLLAALASLGVVEHEEHEVLRRAMQTRNALAHGRRGPAVDTATLQRLSALAETLANQAIPATRA